jgi:hypothetical protein
VSFRDWLSASAFVPAQGDGREPQEGAARVSRVGSHREANKPQASAGDASSTAGVEGPNQEWALDFASDLTARDVNMMGEPIQEAAGHPFRAEDFRHS